MSLTRVVATGEASPGAPPLQASARWTDISPAGADLQQQEQELPSR